MSVGVGLPILGLSRSGSHKSGKMRGVLYEAWEPRAGKDPDIDRDKTPGNIYAGPRAAEEIARLMDARVASFSVARKQAGGRALKNDAQFGAAMIIKPERAWLDGLSDQEKLRFFEDAKAVSCELLGVQTVSSVIHVDEQAWHMHLAFLAELPDGTINYDALFGLKGKKRLNAGFAEKMKERGGWDVKPAELYDADRAKDDPEYKAQMAKKRKEHNQNSAKFKAQRDAQKASEAAQKTAEELRQAEEARRATEADKARVGALKRDLEQKVEWLESSLRWYDGYTERIDSDGPRAAFMKRLKDKNGRTVEDRFQAQVAKDAAERDKAAQAVAAAKAAITPEKQEKTREERIASIPTIRETTVDDYYEKLTKGG